MKRLFLLPITLISFSFIFSACGNSSNNETTTEGTSETVNETEQTVNEEETTTTEEKTTENEENTTDLADKGEKLFTDKACTACHQLDKKTVGPSLQDISKAYNNDNNKLISFFKGEGKAIVSPEEEALMAPQIETITKKMTDEELEALSAYILSK